MRIKPLPLEDYINAIYDRVINPKKPYGEFLHEHCMTARQFFSAVYFNLPTLIANSKGMVKETLEEIAGNNSSMGILFKMDMDYLIEQYTVILNGKQRKFHPGTLIFQENVENIFFYALNLANKQIQSRRIRKITRRHRKYVIEGVKEFPVRLKEFFVSLKLGGLMRNVQGIDDSPLKVLEFYDSAYKRFTGDTSIFDISRKYHLHRWMDNFWAPSSHWKVDANRRFAVYHKLTEYNRSLASRSRRRVIGTLYNLPRPLSIFFSKSLGLKGLMSALDCDENNSPMAILRLFDSEYQKRTGNASLFDGNYQYYLRFNSVNRLVQPPNLY